ncbi:MAG: ECF transporter S component [Oscillospiraceae bacterium]|nr:ECF transporter S component [Oscillospiraceae bacterium]
MQTQKNAKQKFATLFLTQFAILVAIEAIFCFTPLGSLPAIGPIVATLSAIPVIITALLLGTKAGTAMGACFGLFSFLVWTFMPPSPVMAFIFTPFYSAGELSGNIGSLLICFVPRILIGTVAGLLYNGLKKVIANNLVRMIIASAVGCFTNTIGVMLGIWLFFGQTYSTMLGQGILVIIGTTILTSGIPEAVVSAIICPAVARPLEKVTAKFKIAKN